MELPGMEPGMVGIIGDGLPLPTPSLSPPTGGMTHGDHGMPDGTDGTQFKSTVKSYYSYGGPGNFFSMISA
jgi:hypothetical protein